MLVVVASPRNELEAQIIRARLEDAGIPTVGKGPNLPQFGAAGPSDIYVDEQHAARAREALAAPEIDDDELARLSDEAAREHGGDASS